MREVNFYLPAVDVPLLHQVPGYHDFDPDTEVLHCDKPGTGLVDAPRAFSMKLNRVILEKCKFQASRVEPELCYLHGSHGLLCLFRNTWMI